MRLASLAEHPEADSRALLRSNARMPRPPYAPRGLEQTNESGLKCPRGVSTHETPDMRELQTLVGVYYETIADVLRRRTE